MEDRVQGIEQALQMQVQQAQTEQQQRAACEAAATATAAAAAAGKGVRAGKGGVAGAPVGLESIRACLVDLTPSTDPSPNGVIGAL